MVRAKAWTSRGKIFDVIEHLNEVLQRVVLLPVAVTDVICTLVMTLPIRSIRFINCVELACRITHLSIKSPYAASSSPRLSLLFIYLEDLQKEKTIVKSINKVINKLKKNSLHKHSHPSKKDVHSLLRHTNGIDMTGAVICPIHDIEFRHI